MGLQMAVDLLQVLLETGLQRLAARGGSALRGRIRRKHDQCKRLGIVGAGDHTGLDRSVGNELVFDGCRRNVFAFAGLEQVFDPTGNAQKTLAVHDAFVTSAQPSVWGECSGRELGFAVVGLHQGRATHLDLTGGRVHACFNSVVGQADRAGLARAGQSGVRDPAVLGHAIDLDQVQPQAAVPLQHIGRHGRSPARGDAALV